MMENIIHWLEKYEALWLFVLIGGELLMGIYSAVILTMEYFYGLRFNEAIKEARKERRRKKYEVQSAKEAQGETK